MHYYVKQINIVLLLYEKEHLDLKYMLIVHKMNREI